MPTVSRDDAEPLPIVEAEEPAPGTLLLRVRGAFDAATGIALNTVLDDELDGRAFSRLLLDLSRVTVMTPEALSVLHELRRRCRVEGICLVLVGAGRPAVHRQLRMSGLLALFDTRPTVQAALHGASAFHRAAPGRSRS
jgi:anti-anti-sigma factor